MLALLIGNHPKIQCVVVCTIKCILEYRPLLGLRSRGEPEYSRNNTYVEEYPISTGQVNSE